MIDDWVFPDFFFFFNIFWSFFYFNFFKIYLIRLYQISKRILFLYLLNALVNLLEFQHRILLILDKKLLFEILQGRFNNLDDFLFVFEKLSFKMFLVLN
jgi:hypothetical protein